MKISFISQFLPPPGLGKQTGGTISNLNFLRALARQHDVNVLSFDPASNPSLFPDEQFEVTQCSAPSWRAFNILHKWLPFVRNQTRGFLDERGEPDILLATTSTLAAFDTVSSRVRRVAIVRAFENFGITCPWVPLRSRISLGKGAALRRFRDASLLRGADAILTNSVFMKGAISRRFSIDLDRIHVVPQQVDVGAAVSPAPEGIIGFVHRGADKNVALVIELAKRAPDLQFLIFGHDAGFPPNLPSNVVLKGWSADRNGMFASAALWLVPSLWAEPFGRVSIEAQAAGRAVLVANHGGLPETVFDDRFRLDGFELGAWLDRTRLLLKLPREDLAQNGDTIRQRFSAVAHDKAVAEIMSMILDDQKGSSYALQSDSRHSP